MNATLGKVILGFSLVFIGATILAVTLAHKVEAADYLEVTEGVGYGGGETFLADSPFTTTTSPEMVISAWPRKITDPNTYIGGPDRWERTSDGIKRPFATSTPINSSETLTWWAENIMLDEGGYRMFMCLTTVSSADCAGTSVNGETSSYDDLTLASGGVYYFDVQRTGSTTVTLGPNPFDSSSRILNFDVAGFPNNTIALGASYISNTPVVDRICFNGSDLTSFQTLVPICQTINQNGSFLFSTTTVLTGSSTEPHTYRFEPVLYFENTIIDSRLGEVFTVGTSTQSYVPTQSGWAFGELPAGVSSTSTLDQLTLECDPNDGFFSRSICNLAVILFIPSQNTLQTLDTRLAQLMTKQPFSALSEFRLAWQSSVQNPNVESTTLVLNFYGQDVPVVSTTTFYAITGESWGNIRGLIAISLWIAFGWFAFRRVTKAF